VPLSRPSARASWLCGAAPWTVPGPGEPGNDTWKGDSWKHGGAVLWGIGSYDPQTDTVLWGTSNPSPWASAVRSTGNSDYGKFTNLYSSSTLAFDPATGKIKWYLQHTPADAWDFDGINEAVLADLPIGGTNTPVAMVADRNGFFYVMNRSSGHLISAQAFAYENWAKGIDINTTRPIENPDKRPGPNHPAKDICPNLLGGKNWQPMSYDPQTHLVYIPAQNICNDMTELKEVTYRKGIMYLGKEFPVVPGPGGYLGETVAWDPVQQKNIWEIKEPLPFNGGMLTTGGDLVFYGNIAGLFRAVDAKTGNVLWQKQLGSGISAGPIAYSVDGKQYVAIVVGRTAAIEAFIGKIGDKISGTTPEGGTLFVFSE
jgi:PQQ-dependent dehydrogenase (methanol/ethanol family)